MCGIFGVVSGQASVIPVDNLKQVTKRLFELSESRGKEASGLCILSDCETDNISVLKSAQPASVLLRDPQYDEFFARAFSATNSPAKVLSKGALIGHTRLVTNGTQLDQGNNQPVVRDGVIAVHNGIVVNVDELWAAHPSLTKNSDVDTEVIVALAREYYEQSKSSAQALQKVFQQIQGMTSVALIFDDLDVLLLGTNNGSLYIATGSPSLPIYFASERHALARLTETKDLGFRFASYGIRRVEPHRGIQINLSDHSLFEFGLQQTLDAREFDSQSAQTKELDVPRRVEVHTVGTEIQRPSVLPLQKTVVPERFEQAVERVRAEVSALKRCVRCVLLETVPFIAFDSQGVCNFCSNYKKIELQGLGKLEDALRPYRRPGAEQDCVAALSGGRDSCYGLHVMVKELGLKPVSYTYDWGVVTDLARRNISRMCSRLGVEHILISADIAWKRENIQKNVTAWLKKPHLGMVPLFMAGDKQFVWYANRVREQTGVKLDIFTFNLLEKTQFKEEFTGIQFWKPGADSDKLGEELGLLRGLKLCSFYGKEFLTNRGYWNRSLSDTFYGFVAYYILPQTFVPLFQYLDWNEEKVNKVLLEEYDWELAPDCSTTWRIGDGTAPFYNFIYYMLAGFTENDTLRSNQVREGHMTRDQALLNIERENQPRWESIKWYCDIIGLNFQETIDRICAIPRLFTPRKSQLAA